MAFGPWAFGLWPLAFVLWPLYFGLGVLGFVLVPDYVVTGQYGLRGSVG